MRILIAFGSRYGGSEGIAQRIAEVLREAGHEVDLRAASQIDELGGYDAAIIGAGLYAGRWVRSARRLIERHVPDLRRMPVWMFSSGPLDDSARDAELPPTAAVARSMKLIGARGHVTFGGRLTPDSKGFIARALVEQGKAGDFRDLHIVAAWARTIAAELANVVPMPSARPSPAVRPLRRALVGLCWFTGVTAVLGGMPLVLNPQGSEGAPLSMLDGTPFTSLLLPGLLLVGVVGLFNLVAGTLVFRRHRAGELAGFVAGGALTVWITVQMLLLGAAHWLQGLYLTVGVTTLAIAGWLAVRQRIALQDRARPAQLRTIRQVPTPAITS